MILIGRLVGAGVGAFLDRLGGGGFGWVGAKGWLAEGHKWARRYLLPALLMVKSGWSWQHLAGAAILSAVLSFNLDEIAQRDWEEIALHPLALGLGTFLLGGSWWWSGVVAGWWLLGVYLSNVGVRGWKLGWHWVESGRGGLLGGM